MENKRRQSLGKFSDIDGWHQVKSEIADIKTGEGKSLSNKTNAANSKNGIIFEWESVDSDLSRFVAEEAQRTLNAYREQPSLVEEHYGIENAVLTGGYGHRQIYELVQNAADALWEGKCKGRIHVRLTNQALYCANEGAPIDKTGARAIFMSHMHTKKGEQIGHFGLGFKSVLAVSNQPEFYSKSGSFGFNHSDTAKRIRNIVPDAKQCPILRLGYPIDVHSAIKTDCNLEELSKWATTIVKLPRTANISSWLSEDLDSFPSAFILFSPLVKTLILEDTTCNKTRKIEIRQENDEIIVIEGQDRSRWRIFQTSIPTEKLSESARNDANPLWLDREALPVVWAVPLDKKRTVGRFWAFFPTETKMTLSGILNAPWKTNADRENLLDGPFNRELLTKAAMLVASNLHQLSIDDDPASHLDYLPARDTKSNADESLADILFQELSTHKILPDTKSVLCIPNKLFLRPEEVTKNDIQNWLKGTDHEITDVGWCHLSVEQRERRHRATRLGAQSTNPKDWVEAVAHECTEKSSIAAIHLVGKLLQALNEWQIKYLKSAKFILTSDNKLVSPETGNLFLPHTDRKADRDSILVHSTVAEDEKAREILNKFNIFAITSKTELMAYVRNIEHFHSQSQWIELWRLARRVSTLEAVSILGNKNAEFLKVKTVAGNFRVLSETLLPGRIVPSNGDRDDKIAVDKTFHREELELLHQLGIYESPQPKQPLPSKYRADTWFHDYLHYARDAFKKNLPSGQNPQWSYLVFKNNTKTCAPLDPLRFLSKEGKALFVEAMFTYIENETPWEMTHETRSHLYPSIKVKPPLLWIIEQYGLLPTSNGPCKLEDTVGPSLRMWGKLFHVCNCTPKVAQKLGMVDTMTKIPLKLWEGAFERVLDIEDEAFVAKFYVRVSRLGEIIKPKKIWCRFGSTISAFPPHEVIVTHIESVSISCCSAKKPVLRVTEKTDALNLQKKWGLMPPPETKVRWEAFDDKVPLRDAFPGLMTHLPASAQQLQLQPCISFKVETQIGNNKIESENKELYQEDEVIYYTTGLSTQSLLRRIAEHLCVTLDDETTSQVLSYLDRADRIQKLEKIRQCTGLAEKLLEAVGIQNIQNRIPKRYLQVLRSGKNSMPALRAAELALAVYGVNVLFEYVNELNSAGLDPPSYWNGSRRAVEFVEDLGFSREYAGFQRINRAPMLEVEGPVFLKPLHDFQEVIAERIRKFITANTPERGLLSLPTGAGKTRVVAEALIRAIHSFNEDKCLVWIAQSDELCEQSVQTWREIWQAIGPTKMLRISRLWGSTNDRVTSAPGRTHLVVATFQSLVRRVDSPAFKWLKDAFCVIVDEAHGSTTRSYTTILSELGLTAHKTERPLIGLTATPFRGGSDETETKRLVNRYGKNRFDHGVLSEDDPYPELQRMGVLSLVENKLLPGVSIKLDPSEIADLRKFMVLPSTVEQRLGDDKDRNQTLLESISSLPADWPILVFAASVEHAELLAALLCLSGISAQAISSNTDMRARRHYIEEFKGGRLRVLTNYNVLTTGFDAPAIRALIIARPVYSRGLYQQMIGRGLRGPLNGGKEKCLIVNVEDNVVEFREQLAFRHFEHLWNESEAPQDSFPQADKQRRESISQMLSDIQKSKTATNSFKLSTEIKPAHHKEKSTHPLLKCPECNSYVRSDRLKRHLQKVHKKGNPKV